ncbi:10079_t:CDS:2, partial [Scutellospora calospora]
MKATNKKEDKELEKKIESLNILFKKEKKTKAVKIKNVEALKSFVADKNYDNIKSREICRQTILANLMTFFSDISRTQCPIGYDQPRDY